MANEQLESSAYFNNNNNKIVDLGNKSNRANAEAEQADFNRQRMVCGRNTNRDGRRADVIGPVLNVGETNEKFPTRLAAPAEVTRARQSAKQLSKISNWHFLDVDGDSVAASSTSSSCNELDTIYEMPVVEKGCQMRKFRLNEEENISIDKMTTSNGTTKKNQKEACEKEPFQEAISAALTHICTFLYALMPIASFLTFLALLWLIFTQYWFITACYYSYVLLDRKTCNKGGRRFDVVYKSKFWTYLAAYFPIQLKYSDQFRLDPNENYILNYHPHGIAAFGCVTAFATNGLNFTKLFPGIKSHFMVHETSFLVPVMRETFSLRGDCSVNSKSFDYILSKRWKQSEGRKLEAGHLLALCGGGLAEAELSDAETLKIVVATRKGFVKKALIHGANLIPCIGFGENSVFTKINLKPKSLLHRLEGRFYSLFKFKHPMYYGSSVLGGESLHGMMPYKRPITVVMGDPIKVERVEEPSQEQIDRLHAKYMETLQSIYESNQYLCTNYDTRMELV